MMSALGATLALTALLGAPPGATAPPKTPPADPPAAAPATPIPLTAPTPEESAVLDTLLAHASWVRRLIAAQRLERWPADGYAATRLERLAADRDPRVRAAAVLGLARVGAPPLAARMEAEDHAGVIRTMLRCGWPVDAERAERGAKELMKSTKSADRVLGIELVCALDQQKRAPRTLANTAKDTFNSVVARLEREDAGALSPRLALLTGAPDARVDYKWRSWLNRNRLTYTLEGGMLTGPAGSDTANAVTKLSSDEFVRFAGALDEAFKKPIDLGIAIDCTGSMSGELAQAQAGINDVMLFASAAAGGMRVAVVGYRDRGEEWTTKANDFTNDRSLAQANLWQLRAEGGGDEPEMVYEGLKVAYSQFSWRPGDGVQRVLVLVGDAPPHPGFGVLSVDLAREAHKAGITTFVVSARNEKKEEEVPHFQDIARAGGGRVIRLSSRSDLAAELAGVALADSYHDPIVAVFERYLLLCR